MDQVIPAYPYETDGQFTVNSVYVKANFAPYFFELDLLHPIIPEESSAVVSDDGILFTLKKVVVELTLTLVLFHVDAIHI